MPRLVSNVFRVTAGLALTTLLTACATETHQVLEVQRPASAGSRAASASTTISVARFDNRSAYMRGLFSEGQDKLGSQAQTILIGHLQSVDQFTVVDRENMAALATEAKISGQTQKLEGARYTLSGEVVEFGRKEIGDHQLFGILGSSKQQVAYAKVTVNVIDVISSRVVYSAQGAGEYVLSNREVLGFGGTASYDSTLNGKVLDLAIREAVDRLAEGHEQGRWNATAR